MKKFIFLIDAVELLKRLVDGKRVEGALYMDESTGKLTFKPYYRRGAKAKDWLIRKLEHGWVKESKQRIKVYESVPKDLGTSRVIAVLNRENSEAKRALVEHELIMVDIDD